MGFLQVRRSRLIAFSEWARSPLLEEVYGQDVLRPEAIVGTDVQSYVLGTWLYSATHILLFRNTSIRTLRSFSDPRLHASDWFSPRRGSLP